MKLTKKEIQFLKESNAIEGVYSDEALEDAKMAWEYAKHHKNVNLLSILEIHRRLMMRQYPEIAGKYRSCDVFIGGRHCKYEGRKKLTDQVQMALDMINNNLTDPILAHVFFEFVHPFVDGNGRVGRILYNIHRLKRKEGIHVIKESQRQEYYKWFRFDEKLIPSKPNWLDF